MKITVHLPKKNSIALWKDLNAIKTVKKGFTFIHDGNIAEIKKHGANFQIKTTNSEVILSKSEIIELIKKSM